eukprot:COSAG06_NODE_1224_length_10198_cov_15.139816_6_plen_286_part_00
MGKRSRRPVDAAAAGGDLRHADAAAAEQDAKRRRKAEKWAARMARKATAQPDTSAAVREEPQPVDTGLQADSKKKRKKEKKEKKAKKKEKKKKKDTKEKPDPKVSWISHSMQRPGGRTPWAIPTHERICAPMVGGSELAFRLLCRRYSCDLAYTPMINSARFATDPEYRAEQFQTTPEDRPLVVHFSGNDPAQMLAAARHVEGKCDAIDLNLGCPQVVAFTGHYGSFLLDDADRPLVLSIVRTLAENLSIPVFVKIRLLSTLPETIALCQQLAEAGAALIAVVSV